jgi:Fe-S cluster biogenesis protein NfuA
MTMAQVSIVPEATPNPNSTRYAVNRKLLEGAGRDFPNRDAAAASPLARELFLLPAVTGVYVGIDFVTVTTATANAWALPPLVIQCIQHHIASGQPAVLESGGAQPANAASEKKQEWSPEATAIMRILETEIRPAVAMDGGDIVFNSYEDGVLRLHLRGACHSCPSSLVTLKNGIETRLRQDFPNLKAVEAI